MSLLATSLELVAVAVTSYAGSRLGARPARNRQLVLEPVAKYCLCGHVRSHHYNGTGACNVAVKTSLKHSSGNCACMKFYPDPDRDLTEKEKKLGIAS